MLIEYPHKILNNIDVKFFFYVIILYFNTEHIQLYILLCLVPNLVKVR